MPSFADVARGLNKLGIERQDNGRTAVVGACGRGNFFGIKPKDDGLSGGGVRGRIGEAFAQLFERVLAGDAKLCRRLVYPFGRVWL